MTDDDVYYVGNLILNGMGDGQSPQLLSLVPMARRVIAPYFARMQVGAVEVLQNFVAQQVEVIPENRITRRLTELEGDENVAEDHSSHIRSQRRSRSELQLRGVEGGSRRRIVIGAIRRGSSTAVRSGVRRRSTLRVRVRSLSPGSSVVQTATASRRRIVDEGHDGESRE